jgi:hypothetical protein
VIGVGMGRKVVEGKATETPSVRIYVERKIHRSLLTKKARLPKEIGGVPTDVIEIGRFVASAGEENRETRRPFSMGSSIGHFRQMAGTAGMLARAKGPDDGRRFVVSNNHVLANENSLPKGSPIFQAGLLDWDASDDGPPTDPVAELSKFIRLKKTGSNAADCAMAELRNVSPALPSILSIGALSSRDPVAATEGLAVLKSGRTTGVTAGTVFDADFDVEIDYARLGSLVFEDQILIRGTGGAFSAVGDSGALVVTAKDPAPVGLLFAVAAKGSAASHIGQVLDLLDVVLA